MNDMSHSTDWRYGFTLIELSVVLVIIGLIVGGVLVGQDLIRAAAVRATITQIEKYNQAVNTFRGKYAYLPGDILAREVTQFGFTVSPTRAGTQGQGDGSGVLEGIACAGGGGGAVNDVVICGETAWFWEDLSVNTGLIEGGFSTATGTPLSTGSGQITQLVPEAKLGAGTYIYVYSQGGINYYGLSAMTAIDPNGAIYSNPGVSVAQAYNIDKKTDDGYPQTGRVTAQYANCCGAGTAAIQWADPAGTVTGPPYTTAITGSATTCYDNGGVAGIQQYSLSQKGGTGLNCALSFQFQ